MKHPQKNWFIYDTETGGLDSKNHSLLTLYGIVLDELYHPIAPPLDLKIKPNDGIYRVTPGALKKNKIDLVKHDEEAVTVKEAGNRFYKYLMPFTENERLGRIGQNEAFDMDFLLDSGMIRSPDRFFNRKILDTKSIATALQEANKLPKDMDLSLVELAKLFEIDTTDAHNAGHDVHMTLCVLTHLMELMKGK